MRLLVVAQLEAEAPVERLHPPEVREHADEAGEATVVASANVSGATSVGREQLPAERGEVVERAP